MIAGLVQNTSNMAQEVGESRQEITSEMAQKMEQGTREITQEIHESRSGSGITNGLTAGGDAIGDG